MTAENFFEDVRSVSDGAQNPERTPAEATGAVKEIATEDEVRAALLALGDDALEVLTLRAASYGRLLPPEDVVDLVGETLRRVLDGCRKWPKDVPLMAFLLQSMRSIAWEYGKRNRREIPDSRIGNANDDEEETESFIEAQPAAGGNPADAVALLRFAADVERMFGDDDDVMAVIIGRVEGLSAAETRERFEMTPQAFGAAQKRLWRGVVAGKLDGWR
jgi:DNA-directed RNA polymerase specialized sigma24 family protein